MYIWLYVCVKWGARGVNNLIFDIKEIDYMLVHIRQSQSLQNILIVQSACSL